MGFYDWLKGFLGVSDGEPQPTPLEVTTPPSEFKGVSQRPAANQSPDHPEPWLQQWIMPRYRDRDIADWEAVIAQLKRDGRLAEALEIAVGCMDAMVEVARQNPATALEHYVIQVTIIQRKMKDHPAEIQTISSWLETGIPAVREDHRLELRKRLAKAQELLARKDGRDSSEYHAEWKRLVELGKEVMGSGPARQNSGQSQSLTGRTAAKPASSPKPVRRSSRLVPGLDDLMSPEYVAVDFETANRRGGVSACQVALVKVSNGRVVDRFSTLLKPPAGWDTFEFTHLHGIAQRDVRRSPSWMDVVDPIHRFVAGAPVYAHNASFDSRVWRELDRFFSTDSHPGRFFCTYRLAERVIPGLPNYKLPTVTTHCSPGFRLDHHNADSDAEACARIVHAIQTDRSMVQRL